LAAETEADDRLAAARREAATIAASAPDEIERAVAALLARHAEAADVAIAAIEDELAQLDAAAGGSAAAGDPRFDAAVDAVVAAVLGESEGR
jgi:hypothetical protein